MPTHIASTEARQNWSDVLNRAGYGKERFAIERHEDTVAALVSMEDLQMLQKISRESTADAALKALEAVPDESGTASGTHSFADDDAAVEEAIDTLAAYIEQAGVQKRTTLWSIIVSLATHVGFKIPELNVGSLQKKKESTV